MMARVRVKINVKGLNAALSQPGMERELKGIVGRIADRARTTAPVDSGAYKESIESSVDDGWVRPRGRVLADVPYAMNVEASTGNLMRAMNGERRG